MTDKQLRKEFSLWEKIVFFFPVQLLFVHLKKNLILLLFWLLLFGIITKNILLKYGVPYLFLQPEYLGEINFLSHFIIGITTGSFIMAFNISSYVVNGFRFPFLATLNRPFVKYCQNNVIIPFTFSLVYILAFIKFQVEFEQLPKQQVVYNVIGFVSGNIIFIFFTAAYFIFTNKNTSSFASGDTDDRFLNPVKDLFSNRKKWKSMEKSSKKEWKVVSYISKWGSLAIARDSSHYRKSTLERVFAQNRINASLFQAMVIIALFTLGWFYETDLFKIPAAASVLLFFTILIMITSAFYSWFKGWTSLVLIMTLFVINFLSQKEPFQYSSQAYGLNYDTVKADYSQAHIRSMQENEIYYKEDIKAGLRYLENWKKHTGETKPVAVFLNVPGGGLRSAMWTMLSVNEADEVCQQKLWQNTLLLSGSSGGMIGAAYLREYYYRRANDSNLVSMDSIIHQISADKLNPVAATAVMNDLFFRFRSFEFEGKQYTNDRAHAFERQLNKDTRGWLNRKLKDYHQLEFEAKMPMMVLAPTISDDGRKLLISAQGTSYLSHNTAPYQINENIEFLRFFENQGAENLSFLSALRMSATFPYVFPAANLPSNPFIEILDAGIRDNYGISNTLKFIFSFRHWLDENTSRVVILQVRDQEKFVDLKPDKSRSLWESITQPFGTFYNTVLDVQDYQMEDQIRMAYEWYDGEIELFELILERSETNPISLSWHLTAKEKERIQTSVTSEHNLDTYAKMARLFKP